MNISFKQRDTVAQSGRKLFAMCWLGFMVIRGNSEVPGHTIWLCSCSFIYPVSQTEIYMQQDAADSCSK